MSSSSSSSEKIKIAPDRDYEEVLSKSSKLSERDIGNTIDIIELLEPNADSISLVGSSTVERDYNDVDLVAGGCFQEFEEIKQNLEKYEGAEIIESTKRITPYNIPRNRGKITVDYKGTNFDINLPNYD